MATVSQNYIDSMIKKFGLRAFDNVFGALVVITPDHERVHAGKAFRVLYSVPDLGAMTTPNDMITLTFTTPASPILHFDFTGYGAAGFLLKLTEAPTGGCESPTGSVNILNRNRASTNLSGVMDVAATPAAEKMSYDATAATGGTELYARYLEGSTGAYAVGISGGNREEEMLKASTLYQLSLYGTANSPGALKAGFYIK